jgi:hypothetical protein
VTVTEPPHTAEIVPSTEVSANFEIDHCRFVQLARLGTPGIVPEAHVPLKTDPVSAEDEDVELDEPDEPDPLPLPGVGAVGTKRLDLF